MVPAVRSAASCVVRGRIVTTAWHAEVHRVAVSIGGRNACRPGVGGTTFFQWHNKEGTETQ
jgi:hypothetical protein